MWSTLYIVENNERHSETCVIVGLFYYLKHQKPCERITKGITEKDSGRPGVIQQTFLIIRLLRIHPRQSKCCHKKVFRRPAVPVSKVRLAIE